MTADTQLRIIRANRLTNADSFALKRMRFSSEPPESIRALIEIWEKLAAQAVMPKWQVINRPENHAL